MVVIEMSELCIAKQLNAGHTLQFLEQYNVAKGTLERSFGTLHVGVRYFWSKRRVDKSDHSSGFFPKQGV